MKRYLHPLAASSLPVGSPCGTTSFASYQRIVKAMLASGELRLASDEYVSSVVVEEFGLAFIIERKEG